jgi:uncharacterized membrane protein YphA (DoxX/SURF4 family)
LGGPPPTQRPGLELRRTILAAAQRHYPGFFAALFIVLLRIAIGWHFLYEGMEKINSTRRGDRPFSAEVYLRNATGPLAKYFRGIVPDVNGLARLDPARLKASWTAEVETIGGHYGFNQDQRAQAAAQLRDSLAFADIWFQDPEMTEKRRKYIHELREVQQTEWDPQAMTYQRERASERRKELDKERRELLRALDARHDALRSGVIKLATAEQREAAGPYVPPRTKLDWVNDLTMYGLAAMGLCLILGLFTRLAALGGAVFLAQIYLSMPPWPGLPSNPMAEGHYWIVNKNLVEMLACLVIASTPSGHWIGLDALFFGRSRRGPDGGRVEPRRGR